MTQIRADAPASPDNSPAASTAEVVVQAVEGEACRARGDRLAIEEPLEIRLVYSSEGKRAQKSISITMRTPGDDFELACGFLFTEGIIRRADQIARVKHCGPAVGPLGLRNVVRVELEDAVAVDLKRLERHFYTSSSCGVCGKTSIEALAIQSPEPLDAPRPWLSAAVIHCLSDRLREAQAVFEQTGGLHAAALFDPAGKLLGLCEDVGRHNALDKLIGRELLAGRVPLGQRVLLVSGRASFELVQKALAAGIEVMAAVGAPSSLAVELAARYGMTLAGFVRGGRYNIYSVPERIAGLVSALPPAAIRPTD